MSMEHLTTHEFASRGVGPWWSAFMVNASTRRRQWLAATASRIVLPLPNGAKSVWRMHTDTRRLAGGAHAHPRSRQWFAAVNFAASARAGFAVVTVTRTGDLSGTSRVSYATYNGTAQAGLDFRA